MLRMVDCSVATELAGTDADPPIASSFYTSRKCRPQDCRDRVDPAVVNRPRPGRASGGDCSGATGDRAEFDPCADWRRSVFNLSRCGLTCLIKLKVVHRVHKYKLTGSYIET